MFLWNITSHDIVAVFFEIPKYILICTLTIVSRSESQSKLKLDKSFSYINL